MKKTKLSENRKAGLYRYGGKPSRYVVFNYESCSVINFRNDYKKAREKYNLLSKEYLMTPGERRQQLIEDMAGEELSSMAFEDVWEKYNYLADPEELGKWLIEKMELDILDAIETRIAKEMQ